MKKKTRIITDILYIILAFTVLTGCAAEEILNELPRDFGLMQEEEDSEENSEENDTKVVSLEDILAAPGNEAEEPEEWFLMDEAGSYAFDSLSVPEQSWYKDMEAHLGSFGEKTELDQTVLEVLEGTDIDETVDRIFRCVLNDHPEIFYVDGYSCVKYMRGQKIVSMEFSGTYTMNLDNALAYRDAIEEAADGILGGIGREASDYDKVKYVYDTIIRGTDYDLSAPENQNIYSVFVNHRSVCQGYAKAAQYLLNRLGIESTLVLGTVDTGEGHAWNLVKVDGDYYYVDTTWGDVSYQIEEESSGAEEDVNGGYNQERGEYFGEDGAEPSDSNSVPDEEEHGAARLPEINYDYLNVTTEELLRTHSIGGAVPMPVCTAREANYYIREGAYFTSYDKEQMTELFRYAWEADESSVNIKCADAECYQDVFEALVNRQEIFDYMEQEGSIAYAQNEKQLSLTFWVTNE